MKIVEPIIIDVIIVIIAYLYVAFCSWYFPSVEGNY